MNRGEVWLARVGSKRRPVLILTRSEVIDLRALVTIAEVTTSARGLGTEVALDRSVVGLDRESVVNCDGIHTVARSSLTECLGAVGPDVMTRVCDAVDYAVGCWSP